MRRVFMTVLLLAAAAVSGKETVIANFKDVVLTPTKSKWSAETKSFRVFAKTAQKYRNKQIVFRMNAKRTAGDQALGATFRCSVKPGGLKATQNFRFSYTKNGDEVPIEAVFTVPDLDNISQFNIQVGFNKLGKVPTVWEFKNVRFCEFDEAAAKISPKRRPRAAKPLCPKGSAPNSPP